jgi:hypothetical protein
VLRDVLGWDALPKGVEDFVENFMFFEGAGSSIVRPLPFGRCHVDPCAHATHMPVTDDTVSYGKKPPPVFEGGGGKRNGKLVFIFGAISGPCGSIEMISFLILRLSRHSGR